MGQKAAGKKLRRSKPSKGINAKAGKRHNGAPASTGPAGAECQTKFPYPRFLWSEVRSDRQRQWKGYAKACQKASTK